MVDNRIVVDSKICGGRPTIRGTRIMVKNILGMVAGGYTMAGIIEAYPELTNNDVTAALEYASQVIDEAKVIPRA
ncbi:Antitoxin [Nitrospira defluvii]|uniref:Antitoxin n=1 Tax=Nitrospira defluvii TaxID=330214 RepID=A0ABN7KI40_9BACT|nr:Antitoxin [Nitrospira defluvii]